MPIPCSPQYCAGSALTGERAATDFKKKSAAGFIPHWRDWVGKESNHHSIAQAAGDSFVKC